MGAILQADPQWWVQFIVLWRLRDVEVQQRAGRQVLPGGRRSGRGLPQAMGDGPRQAGGAAAERAQERPPGHDRLRGIRGEPFPAGGLPCPGLRVGTTLYTKQPHACAAERLAPVDGVWSPATGGDCIVAGTGFGALPLLIDVSVKEQR